MVTTTTTIAHAVQSGSNSDWTATAAAIAAFFAAVAAVGVWVIAGRQLAVTRAQSGERGSVKVYPARSTFDPRVVDNRVPFSRLRDVPEAVAPSRVRVAALHLRNVGPMGHRVELAVPTAWMGARPKREVKVYPAWGPHSTDVAVPPRDYLALPPARGESSGTADFVVFLVDGADWPDQDYERLRLTLVCGGGERVEFDEQVRLWRFVEE